jgi:4,5-dihydroxyphthalate decarboxylase
LPSFARSVAGGRALRDMLLEGEIDAIMCPAPPEGVLEPDSPIVRLIPNYREVEHQYYRRIGFYPAHHIMGVRREVFDRHPWVVRSLFLAFEQSKTLWLQERRELADTTPWLLADIEETMALMGFDWQVSGVEPNLKMTQALCDEQLAQGVINQPLDARTVFAEFQDVMHR